jgi:TonB family protein
MNMQLTRSLKISTVMHAIVVTLLLVSPLLFTGFHKSDPAIPVEFRVAVPQAAPEPWVKPSPPAPVETRRDSEEVVLRREPSAMRTTPKSVDRQPAVQHSQRKVTRYEPVRTTATVQSATPLSQSEIRRLLAMGAKPGNETVIPGAEARFLETIRTALYNAWSQPTAGEAGSAVVEVEIQLGADGVVTGWRIVKRSGVVVMDASVARALQGIRQIQGLTPTFIGAHATVTVAFRVEQ